MLIKEDRKSFSWDFYATLIILSYCVLQILRWQILPQFMDIYYHFSTAWGFIQAGGYTGWDFWQYAPIGRFHIYPPLFHLILAFLLKLGASPVVLAKFFEMVSPPIFLITLWQFIKRNYNDQLAFFVLVTIGSSFSFYLSLMNHVPATLALIFGLFALDQLLQKKPLSALLLFALCFYTHIGISWFFILTLLFYGLLNQEDKRLCLGVLVSVLVLSLPILLKQLVGIKFITNLGLSLNEKYLCQIKVFDYIFAFLGLISVYRLKAKFRLFLSLFLASFIFVIYPYRFFSAEGYLSISLLFGVSLYNLYRVFKKIKYLVILIIPLILFFSPTLSLNRSTPQNKLTYKIKIFDSALLGMLGAKGESLWHPQEYLSATHLIKINSRDDDIIYSTLNIAGMALAGLSGRPTANALLPEIGPYRQFNPWQVSKIIIFTQDDDPEMINRIVDSYKLIRMGENKLFILYKNISGYSQAQIKKTSVPFWLILIITFVLILLYIRVHKILPFRQ